MNANTLKAITRHGETLLRAFPNCTDKNPVALCKKLRRIEVAAANSLAAYENGGGSVSQDTLDSQMNQALIRTCNLLGQDSKEAEFMGVHINRDFRGHQLKIDSDAPWFRKFQDDANQNRTPALHTDMGGYGIIAPDLNQ